MVTDFEAARQAQIQKNKARLQELGLLETVRNINSSMTQERQQNRVQKAARKAAAAAPRDPKRRSERVQGKDAPNYNERALACLGLAEEEEGGRKRRLLRENTSEEVYTLDQIKLLGSASQPWELFVDGYDSKGERIYDKVNGLTCHQCRQKTLGKRTACSCCQSLRGVFCGDCLYMRYGENVEEVNANPEWVCPVCRNLCNCSFHRIRKSWAPTGMLYRTATAEGFKSVAHYLVLTNLRPEDRPQAAHMLPEGWAWEETSSATATEPAEGVTEAAPSSSGSEQTGVAAAAVDAQLLSLPTQSEAEEDSDAATAAAAVAAEDAPTRGRRGSGRRSSTLQDKSQDVAGGAEQQVGQGRRQSARGAAAASAKAAPSRQTTLAEVSRKRKAAEPAGNSAPSKQPPSKGTCMAGTRRGLRSAAAAVAAL